MVITDLNLLSVEELETIANVLGLRMDELSDWKEGEMMGNNKKIVYCVDEVHAKYVELKTRIDILKSILEKDDYISESMLFHVLGIYDFVHDLRKKKMEEEENEKN